MKPNAESLFKELNHYCKDHADEAMVKKYSRYFKDGYNAYGLTQALMGHGSPAHIPICV